MMKELDTVFLNFAVELLDYPKRMPFRAERASLGCSFFQGGIIRSMTKVRWMTITSMFSNLDNIQEIQEANGKKE